MTNQDIERGLARVSVQGCVPFIVLLCILIALAHKGGFDAGLFIIHDQPHKKTILILALGNV